MKEPVDKNRVALAIRQPWAELILRGHKTIEVRTTATTVRGTIYIYSPVNSSDLPAAQQAATRFRVDIAALPTVNIVGTVEIVDCRPCVPDDSAAALLPTELLVDRYAWVMANPTALKEPREVRFRPYGIWFYPFRTR